MDRLISEQAVIESIEFFQMNPQHFDFVSLIDDIKELPPGQPEQKTGHWIKSNIGGAKVCSACNAHMGLSNFKFCPNCGAKMEDK